MPAFRVSRAEAGRRLDMVLAAREGLSRAAAQRVIAAGSVTGYRVKETPFGQSNTAVGRTSSITGTITVSSGTLEFLLNPSHA